MSHIRPRCFADFDPAEAGVDYRASRKAWMNRGIFFGWLALFHEHIEREEGRRAVLMVENALCHGKTADLPYLRNVDVIYLPKCNTSKLQPLDSGVIATVKHNFRLMSVGRAIDLVDRNVFNNLYDVDLRTTIIQLEKVWRTTGSSTVANCWKKTGLLHLLTRNK